MLIRTGIWLAFVLAVVEGMFRLAGYFAPGRATPWRAGARRHVLCIGDSHTHGAVVEPDEAYPAQLLGLLDATSPGVRLFPSFNRAMTDVVLVDSPRALRRIPADQVGWTFGMHAGPKALTEIARDVAVAIGPPS